MDLTLFFRWSAGQSEMKIQCDVCCRAEARVFCASDEAALCLNCDHHIHSANKLASQHPRTPLVENHRGESPLCDTCKEKRALVFCQEDRAILCTNCDLAAHQVNQYTRKHSRFLFTRIKVGNNTHGSAHQNWVSSQNAVSQNSAITISEYLLMGTLPCWQVEDLLESTSSFCYQ